MTLKVSDRDKKLLLVLLIVIILVGAIKLFDVLSTAALDKETEYNNLKNQYTELTAQNARRSTYVAGTETAAEEYRVILDKFNTSLSQEQSLVFLGLVEKETGVWLKQVGFTEVSNIYSFGEVTSTNPMTSGQKVYSSDYEGISTTMTLAYECSYDDLKKVLDYLEKHGRKATVSDISFSYSQSTDTVTGTMQMTLYAITGSDRDPANININDISVGTDNIFASDTFISSGVDTSYRDQIINNYDLYMIMNQPGSDMSTIAVGMSGDPANESALTTDSTGTENVTITVKGTAGAYTVNYKMGSGAYPTENFNQGAPLVCGDTLDLLIISKERVDEKDTNKANVTIINESDMALNVAVVNDDTDSPRINIQKTEGNVIFFE